MVRYYDDLISIVFHFLGSEALQSVVRLNEIFNFQVTRPKCIQNPKSAALSLAFDVSRAVFPWGHREGKGSRSDEIRIRLQNRVSQPDKTLGPWWGNCRLVRSMQSAKNGGISFQLCAATSSLHASGIVCQKPFSRAFVVGSRYFKIRCRD